MSCAKLLPLGVPWSSVFRLWWFKTAHLPKCRVIRTHVNFWDNGVLYFWHIYMPSVLAPPAAHHGSALPRRSRLRAMFCSKSILIHTQVGAQSWLASQNFSEKKWFWLLWSHVVNGVTLTYRGNEKKPGKKRQIKKTCFALLSNVGN